MINIHFQNNIITTTNSIQFNSIQFNSYALLNFGFIHDNQFKLQASNCMVILAKQISNCSSKINNLILTFWRQWWWWSTMMMMINHDDDGSSNMKQTIPRVVHLNNNWTNHTHDQNHRETWLTIYLMLCMMKQIQNQDKINNLIISF